MHCRIVWPGIACVALALLSACHRSARVSAQAPISRPGWTLTWSDEFNQPDGSPPDPAKWKIEVNGEGGGNKELEYYTARPQNLHVKNGIWK